MILKFLRFFQGFVTLELTGDFTERFLNICMARGIVVWGVKKPQKNKMLLCLSAKDFFRLRPVAKKTKTKVKILEKRGFFIEIRRHKKRKFFFFGIAFFIVFVFVMSRFIWHIEIHGLTYTPKEQIMKTLKEEGVYPGALKSRLDQMKIKNNVLLKEKDLSWIWVDLKGTKAIVSLSERTLAPKIEDRTTPCDIIATKDGIISSYTVTGGTPKIKEGDSVLAGQTLISSVVTSDIIAPRYTNASGEVWARTWYTKEDNFSPVIYPLQKTEEEKRYVSINILGFDINLFFKARPPYDTYTETQKETELLLFGRTTGITIKEKIFTKTEKTEQTLSEDELLEYAKEKLLDKINPELTDKHELVSQNISYSKNSDGSYKITLTAEFVEQIGMSVEVINPLGEKPAENNEETPQ